MTAHTLLVGALVVAASCGRGTSSPAAPQRLGCSHWVRRRPMAFMSPAQGWRNTCVHGRRSPLDRRRPRLACASEGGDGAEEPPKKELTREEQSADIRRTVSDAMYEVGSKMMTIDSITMDDIAYNNARRRRPIMAPTKPVDPKDIATVRAEQAEQFQAQKLRLVGDNVFISLLGVCVCWGALSFKAAVSYGLGGLLGTAYLFLLARFVEGIGAEGGGGGGGAARLALAGLLILMCGKNRDTLEVIPAVTGFLMYQVATLAQGLYTDGEEA